MTRHRSRGALIVVALLLAAACGMFLWEPWHGPVILSLSEGHGIDAGDLPALPLLGLAVAIGHGWAREGRPRARGPAGRWALAGSAVLLGTLLLLGAAFIDRSDGEALLPAGGGTFDGRTAQHTDGRQADPVDRWTHLAVTYDGTTLRLYVNGSQVSSRALTGTILGTDDPLWIGGNRPYGEYFQGVIDDVRVYDRALRPSEVRAEMSTPIRRAGTSPAAGLVAAYAFDTGSGTVAADLSGKGNTGEIIGATWTTRGRFGSALRFDGNGQAVRVPASASLGLRRAVTLSAWSRPSNSQDGWRTIMSRQTDAYFLMAGGGNSPATSDTAGAIDDARAGLFVAAALWFCLALAGGAARRVGWRERSWWPPVTLFLAGSVVDAALTPSSTLVGATLVAAWFAVTASRRGEAVIMYIISAVFTGVTVVSLTGQGGSEPVRHDGGLARSAALGLLFVTAGLLGARFGSRRRDAPSG